MLKITKSRFYLVPVLMRALDILEVLSSSDAPLKMNDLSHSTGISKTTTYRILRTLVYRGYVVQDLEGRFSILDRPGPKSALPEANEADAKSARSTDPDLSGEQVIEFLYSVLQALRQQRNNGTLDQAIEGMYSRQHQQI